MKTRVLVADDEESSRSGLVLLLTTLGYEVESAENGDEAIERARTFRPAVVIADLVMPGTDGLGVLKAVRAELPHAVTILLTGHASIETAVAAMREGAYDYMTKPVEPRRLRALLDKAIEKAEVAREVTVLRRQLQEVRGMGLLLGTSPAMQRLRAREVQKRRHHPRKIPHFIEQRTSRHLRLVVQIKTLQKLCVTLQRRDRILEFVGQPGRHLTKTLEVVLQCDLFAQLSYLGDVRQKT